MSIPPAQKLFFQSSEFAVVGASKDAEKWGTKVLQWYIDRNMTVSAVHLKENELAGIATIPSLSELNFPQSTGLSIITPAHITIQLLKEAKALHMSAIWIQPGASDAACVKYIKDNDMTDRVILGGPCVLTDGDGITRSML